MKYHINIFFSQEDEGFIADVPDLANCSAFGDTQDEALQQVLLAAEAWIESAQANGKALPPPRYSPAIYRQVS